MKIRTLEVVRRRLTYCRSLRNRPAYQQYPRSGSVPTPSNKLKLRGLVSIKTYKFYGTGVVDLCGLEQTYKFCRQLMM